MGFGPYLFVIFVFALIVAAIWFFTKMTKKEPEESVSFSVQERERKLFQLYTNLEEMMLGIEQYLEESKEELATEKEEIETLMQQMRELAEHTKTEIDFMASQLLLSGEKAQMTQEKKETEKNSQPTEEKKQPTEEKTQALPKQNAAYLRVKELKGKGYTQERIAKELSLTIGEVSLILGMQK